MIKYTVSTLLAVAALGAVAGTPSAAYNPSTVEARLNVTVEKDTKVVHFVRDMNDPNVITKAYVLKHADPYELRSLLRKVVQTRRVNTNKTNIKPVQYTDGTSLILISAEDYRFADSDGNHGFDTLVAMLDKPKFASSSGRKTYVYAPKFCAAADLMKMVSAIGANSPALPGDPGYAMDNLSATDSLAVDPELNLMFFKTAPFSQASILAALSEYDRPTSEVHAKVTVYELYAENDAKLGLDFQAWKNNDGIELFSAGGRFHQNYLPNGADLMRNGGWSDTRYFQFNPKWNTKYVDFLVSKGKAKVVHTANLNLTNRKTSSIARKTQIFIPTPREVEKDNITVEYAQVAVEEGAVLGADFGGKAITAAAAGVVSVTKMGKEPKGYALYSNEGFIVNDKNVGKEVNAAVITFETSWTDVSPEGFKGKAIDTVANDNGYGFEIEMTPSITAKSTQLAVKVSNSSLIGYTSSGQPRIQKGADLETSFMIANGGTKLVIGGIEKRDVVSVSGGIPILKDLPILGWIFSTESESTKRSQLLVVAEVVPVKAGETFTECEKKAIDGIREKLNKAGESNTFGYRQFLIDGDR